MGVFTTFDRRISVTENYDDIEIVVDGDTREPESFTLIKSSNDMSDELVELLKYLGYTTIRVQK